MKKLSPSVLSWFCKALLLPEDASTRRWCDDHRLPLARTNFRGWGNISTHPRFASSGPRSPPYGRQLPRSRPQRLLVRVFRINVSPSKQTKQILSLTYGKGLFSLPPMQAHYLEDLLVQMSTLPIKMLPEFICQSTFATMKHYAIL